MSYLSLLLIAICVSIDALLVGFALGLNRVRLTLPNAILLGFWALCCSAIAMFLGLTLSTTLSFSLATWLSGLLLMGLGLYTALHHTYEIYHEKKQQTAPHLLPIKKTHNGFTLHLLGLAVALDASAAAFSLGLQKQNVIVTISLIFLAHALLSLLGNTLGRHHLLHKVCALRIAPGILLMGLGLSKILL